MLTSDVVVMVVVDDVAAISDLAMVRFARDSLTKDIHIIGPYRNSFLA